MKEKLYLVLLILLLTPALFAQNPSQKLLGSSEFEKLENTLEQIFRPGDGPYRNDAAARELWYVDSPESAKKLGSDSIALLGQLEKKECFSLLHNLSLNPQSSFVPFKPSADDKYYNVVRNFRYFRGCCIAQGWQKYFIGETEEACKIFCDLVSLGSQLSQKAYPLATVGGAGITKSGLFQIEAFMRFHPEIGWKKVIQVALKKLPRPVINYTGLLVNERKRIQYTLDFIRQNLDSWKARKDIPWLGPTASPEQKCVAYQTILLFAMIVKHADLSFEQQSKPESVDKMKELILKETALEKWPVCPEGGSYTIPVNLSNEGLCSIHPPKLPLKDGTVRDENFSFGIMPIDFLTIVDTPEFEIQASQALNLIDSLIQLSPLKPDAASKTSELSKQYAYSGTLQKPNLIIKSLMTTEHSEVINTIQEIQEKIDALIR